MARRHRGRHRRPARHHLTAARVALVGAGALAGIAGQTAEAVAGPDGGWGPIIACESSGNPAATTHGSNASGLYQFLDSSWRFYGGLRYASRAMYATPAEQTAIAERAYAKDGLQPWAESRRCWAGKVSATPAAAHLVASVPVTTSWATGPYTVRPGDTLVEIAAAHRTTWRAVYAVNRGVIGDDPDLIHPGQALRL